MKEEDIRKKETLDRYLDLVKEDTEAYFNDKSDFMWVSCPACFSKEYKEEFCKSGFSYVSCNKCETLYCNPRPTIESLKDFYTKAASTKYWIEKFFKPVAEERRKYIFSPRAEYVTNEFGKNMEWVIGDIGAGFGLFLEELRKRWPLSRFVAIEPSPEQGEICRKKGIEVHSCFIEEIGELTGQFDLLTSFELFEHILQPLQFLQKIYDLHKPGGHLILTTFNNKGFDILLLWDQHKNIFPPVHINFFNLQSITILLKYCGFLMKKIETPGRLDWDIVENMIYEGTNGLGRLWPYFAATGSKDAKEELQGWIQKHLLSSHMRILAQKPAK